MENYVCVCSMPVHTCPPKCKLDHHRFREGSAISARARGSGVQGEAATQPLQCALSMRAGMECVTHIVQALTSENLESTILSIDGIGACDSIRRNAMFRGVADMCDGDKLIPFVRLFYGSLSTYLWEDNSGKVRHVQQGEGGEHPPPPRQQPLPSSLLPLRKIAGHQITASDLNTFTITLLINMRMKFVMTTT